MKDIICYYFQPSQPYLQRHTTKFRGVNRVRPINAIPSLNGSFEMFCFSKAIGSIPWVNELKLFQLFHFYKLLNTSTCY